MLHHFLCDERCLIVLWEICRNELNTAFARRRVELLVPFSASLLIVISPRSTESCCAVPAPVPPFMSIAAGADAVVGTAASVAAGALQLLWSLMS